MKNTALAGTRVRLCVFAALILLCLPGMARTVEARGAATSSSSEASATMSALDPAAWVVSLPSERRPTATDAMGLWCAKTWSARARRVAESLRGPQSFVMVADGAEPPRRSRWRVAAGGAVRATKLGLFHLVVYWRSSLALVSPAGRRRLRFWH